MIVGQRGTDWRIALYLLIEGYWSNDYEIQYNKKKQFVKKEQA